MDRQWEMVSPPQKNGASISITGYGARIESADSGDAFTYAASRPEESEPVGFASVQEFSSARLANGWQGQTIGDSPRQGDGRVGWTRPEEYRYFSADLSVAAT